MKKSPHPKKEKSKASIREKAAKKVYKTTFEEAPFSAKLTGQQHRFIISHPDTIRLQANLNNIDFTIGEKGEYIFSPNSKENEHMPCIIFFPGSDCCIEEKLEDMLELSITLNCHVIGANYPGIGNRPLPENFDYSFDALVNDGIALFQDASRLSKPILLYGHSLGAAVATEIAGELLHDFPEQASDVYLINDRGFSKVERKIAFTQNTKQHNKFLLGIYQVGTTFASWNIDSLTPYQQYPEDRKLALQSVDDKSYVPHEISLGTHLKGDDKATNFMVYKDESIVGKYYEPHNVPLSFVLEQESKKPSILIINERFHIRDEDEMEKIVEERHQMREDFSTLLNDIGSYLVEKNDASNDNAFRSIEEKIKQHPEILFKKNIRHAATKNSAAYQDDLTLLHLVFQRLHLFNPGKENVEDENKVIKLLTLFFAYGKEHGLSLDQQSLNHGSVHDYIEELRVATPPLILSPNFFNRLAHAIENLPSSSSPSHLSGPSSSLAISPRENFLSEKSSSESLELAEHSEKEKKRKPPLILRSLSEKLPKKKQLSEKMKGKQKEGKKKKKN